MCFSAKACNIILVTVIASMVVIPSMLQNRDEALSLANPRPPVPKYGRITTIVHSAETMAWIQKESGTAYTNKKFASQYDVYYESQMDNCDPDKNFVVLEGANSQTWFYDGLIAKMRAKGFCTLAFDWRSHGRSEDAPGAISAELLAADSVAIIKHVFGNKKVHIFGWSLGGMISYLLAIYHPDMVASTVVHGATSCWGAIAADGSCDDTPGLLKKVFSCEPLIRLLGNELEGQAAAGAMKIKKITEPITTYFNSLRMNAKVNVPQAWLNINGKKYYGMINQIKAPFLQIQGEHEHLASGSTTFGMTQEAARIPNAEEPVEMPGLSHFALVEGDFETAMWPHLDKFYNQRAA